MGGLVGGIYATGRSPAEVRELINGIDWDQVLSGVTPFPDLSFRRKEDAHEVPGSLEFGLRGGLQFSSGFNTGQEVNLVLDNVALPYSEVPAKSTRIMDILGLVGKASILFRYADAALC
jgi:NTE family protein